MKNKILIAEDEPAVQKTLTRGLREEAYEVVSAGNGREALDLASAGNPDVILLDINMPEKTGWDVLQELRRNARTRLTPVIMITGVGGVANAVSGLRMGADDYITKPFDMLEVKARIASILRRNLQALSANPLTRLPGSPMIEEEVNRRIRSGLPFAFFYADIDHFKSYNDAYGYARGDRVIVETADLLLEGFRSIESKEGFAGHIGGDDFVLISLPSEAPELAWRISTEFDRRAPDFYDEEDRRRGSIAVPDRAGLMRDFPLMSLSIGIATNVERKLDHYAKVVDIASELKTYCKSRAASRKSRFAFDRRRDDRKAQAFDG